MERLRVQIEKDLAQTLEAEFAVPCELTSPDGITQVKSKNNPAMLLSGQVLYFTQQIDPVTGEKIVVNHPVITLRITSLDRVPMTGERWFLRMPVSPVAGAEYVNFVISTDRNPETGTDMGFVRYYPQRLDDEEGAG